MHICKKTLTEAIEEVTHRQYDVYENEPKDGLLYEPSQHYVKVPSNKSNIIFS